MNIRAGLVSALAFTSVFLYPVIMHIDKPLGIRDDVSYAYFLMDNNLSKFAAGDIAHLFDTRMFYPLKNTLALGNSMLGQAIMGLPVYLLTGSAVTTTNAVMILHYFLSYLFLYLLAYTLTKSAGGSLIAAVIYAFNPYMMSRVHPELVVFEWMPLIFLAAEHLLSRITWRWTMVGALCVIMLLLSSFYYFFFAALFVPVYVGVRMWTRHGELKHFFRAAIVVGIAVAGIIGYVYLRPFLAQKRAYHVYRTITGVAAFSAGLPDFLFTTPENLLYGNLGRGRMARELWSPVSLVDPFEHPYEHRFFPGVVATLFFVAAIWFFVRNKFSSGDRRIVAAYGILLALSLILVFGPATPLYRLLYTLPFADTLRAPSRFIVIALLSLSVSAAFVWKKINSRILLVLLIVVLCIEYRYDFGSFTDIPAATKALYQSLDRDKTIRTIIEVPMANDTAGGPFIARSDIEDAIYLYYALFHHKHLVNGYSGYIPPVFQKIGRSVDSEFPSAAKLSELKHMGVDAVIVHLDEYLYPSYGTVAIRGFEELGLKEIARTDTIRVYKIYE